MIADAMEEIHDVFKEAGGKMVGYWPTEGYQHAESKVKPRLLLSYLSFLGKVAVLLSHPQFPPCLPCTNKGQHFPISIAVQARRILTYNDIIQF